MRTSIFRARLLTWVAALVVLGGAACDDDRASVLDPVGDPSFNFTMTTEATGLPTGAVTRTIAGADSTVRLNLRNLGALASGVYQFWVVTVDTATGLATVTPVGGRIVEHFRRDSLVGGEPVIDPITGEDTIRVRDSTVITPNGGLTYAGTNDPFVDSVRVYLSNTDAVNTINPYRQHAVVVSMEAGQTTVPGPAQFLWRRFGVGGNGAMSFGNFGGPDVISAASPTDYLFAPAGSGLGGFRGGELAVDFQQLSRPPVGFYYALFLTGAPDDRATFVDTLEVDLLRSAYSADSTVSRKSLYDADVDQSLPGVTPLSISRSQVRNCVSGSGVNNCQSTLSTAGTAEKPWSAYLEARLNLVPKGAPAGLGRTRVLLGAVPAPVQ